MIMNKDIMIIKLINKTNIQSCDNHVIKDATNNTLTIRTICSE